jgi:glutaredoxin 2
MTKLEISLQEALESAGLVCLPDQLDTNSKQIWLKAIGLVRKINGSRNYVLLAQKDGVTPQIIQDFGDTARIMRLEVIYPYYFLEKRFIPKLKTDEDILKYLSVHSKEAQRAPALLNNANKSFEQINADRKAVKAMVIKAAVAYAQVVLDDEIRYKKILANKVSKNDTERSDDRYKFGGQSKRGRKPNNSKQQ